MAYLFQHSDDDIEAGFRRIAADQLGSAVKALESDGDRAKAVHSARKAIKKTRALLRLVRPGFRAYGRENAALRDIGRRLAPLRDADVCSALLDHLCAEAGLVAADRTSLCLAETEARKSAPEAQIRIAARDLGKLARRAEDWSLKGRGLDALAGGIERTASEAMARMCPALEAAEAGALHDFRKRVKDRWYHARLLTAIWPEAMAVEIAAANALGERLGEHEDLTVLTSRLQGEGPAADAVRDLIRNRKARLLTEIRPLARRVCAESPGALSARWITWWKNAEPPMPMR